MDRQFLNDEECKKMSIIKNFVSGIDTKQYDNRFNNFSSDKKAITWEEITDWVNELSEMIMSKYTGIYGIPRGGLIIATLLSYKTNIPLLLAPQGNCLVVDDDMSTGLTLLQYMNRYDTAVMFKNPNCKLYPTYLYQEYGETFRYFIWNDGGK